MSTGCADDRAYVEAAGAERGRAEASVILPDWPSDCRKVEPHAPLVTGIEVRAVLDRERAALDRQNDRTLRCAGHYDNLKRGFER